MENTKQSVMKSGNLNPMAGKRHSLESKKKISDSQKNRYQAIRNALNERELMSYADTSVNARKEVLKHLIETNELSFESVQQVINFIAIVVGKKRMQQIIRDEIDKLVAECHKVGNNKKDINPDGMGEVFV